MSSFWGDLQLYNTLLSLKYSVRKVDLPVPKADEKIIL